MVFYKTKSIGPEYEHDDGVDGLPPIQVKSFSTIHKLEHPSPSI